MCKLTLLLLLATAAAPALAQAGDDRRGRDNRNSSSEQSEGQQQRGSEARRSELRGQRGSESRRSEASEQRASLGRRSQDGGQRALQRSEPGQASQQGAMERGRERYQQQRQRAASSPSDSNDSLGNRPGRDGAASGQAQTNWRERERRVPTIPDARPTTTQRSAAQRDGFRDPNRRDYRDGNYNRWSNHWRHDRRYDWRGYRNRHRSVFHIGFYHDPFGWNYRRWSTGSYMYPSYYRSSFWLNDPWQYRLPPAYGPYRWVRYWKDALLVNTYTGEVVDVIHGFFW